MWCEFIDLSGACGIAVCVSWTVYPGLPEGALGHGRLLSLWGHRGEPFLSSQFQEELTSSWACGLFLTSRFRVLWWIKFLLTYLLIKCCLHLTKGINEPNIFLMVSFSQSSLSPFNFPLSLKREKQYSSVQLEHRRCTPHDPWDLQCGLRERVSALCVQSPLLKSVPTVCGCREGDTRECLEQ